MWMQRMDLEGKGKRGALGENQEIGEIIILERGAEGITGGQRTHR
jgi:hypothetical protein